MKMSDNKFPKVILEERLSDGSDTSNPAADHRSLFLGEDGLLRLRDSSGAITTIGGGTPSAHAASHEAGGDDEIDVTGLVGAGGGGGSAGFYHDGLTLHSTLGDEFTGASLDAKWTPRGLFNADHAGYAVGGTWMQHWLPGLGQGVSIFQASPSKETFKIITAQSVIARSGTPVVGPMMVSSTGTGLGIGFRPDENNLIMYNLSSYYYASGAENLGVPASFGVVTSGGQKVWLMLELVPTALDGDIFIYRFSTDGFTWSSSRWYNPTNFTLAQIGWGCFYVPTTAAKMAIDRFNVVEDYDVGNNLVRTPTSGTPTYTASSTPVSAANAADGTTSEWYTSSGADNPAYWQVAWSVGQDLNRVVFKERNGDSWGGPAHLELVNGSGTHYVQIDDDVIGSLRWRSVDFPTLTGVTSMRIENDTVSGGGTNMGLVEVEAYLRS